MRIGWYKDGKAHGNHIRILPNGVTNEEFLKGWHENHRRIKAMEDDAVYKNFEVTKCFKN